MNLSRSPAPDAATLVACAVLALVAAGVVLLLIPVAIASTTFASTTYLDNV